MLPGCSSEYKSDVPTDRVEHLFLLRGSVFEGSLLSWKRVFLDRNYRSWKNLSVNIIHIQRSCSWVHIPSSQSNIHDHRRFPSGKPGPLWTVSPGIMYRELYPIHVSKVWSAPLLSFIRARQHDIHTTYIFVHNPRYKNARVVEEFERMWDPRLIGEFLPANLTCPGRTLARCHPFEI